MLQLYRDHTIGGYWRVKLLMVIAYNAIRGLKKKNIYIISQSKSWGALSLPITVGGMEPPQPPPSAAYDEVEFPVETTS